MLTCELLLVDVLLTRSLSKSLAFCESERCLPVSPHGEFAPIEFAPTLTHVAIKCFKFIFLVQRKKDNIVRMMQQNIIISCSLIH